jgi:acyl-CoA reductase-like NAD-dependent aldehyde dehydrogenase
MHSAEASRCVDWIARAGALQTEVRNFIGGISVAADGAGVLRKANPRDGSELYSFASGSMRDVEAAVMSARHAFVDGRWSRLPAHRRSDALYRLAALMLEYGGKAANILFGDVPDLAAVADAIVARAFWNQGQVCTASSRLVVQPAGRFLRKPRDLRPSLSSIPHCPGRDLRSRTVGTNVPG